MGRSGLGLAKPKLYRVLRFGRGKITTRYIIGPVWANSLILGLGWVGQWVTQTIFMFFLILK
jgi:hypothetical protein